MQRDASWCPHPYKYLMISPEGTVKPCCRFRYGHEQLRWGPEQSPMTIFKGMGFNSIREQMSTGQQVNGCSKCDLEDQAGLVSMRRRVLQAGELSADQKIELEGLEIGFSRLCNLRCRSCNGQFSTKWESDEKKMGIETNYNNREISVSDFSHQDLASLKSIKITGGEPFLSVGFHEFIDYLYHKDLLKNIDCELFTNATIPPKPLFLEKLSRFKTLKVGLSVDAYGSRNNYIRNPARWEDVVKSATIWDLFCFDKKQLQVSLAVTISLYNVIYIFDLLRWWRENFPQRNFFLQIASEPDFLSIYNLSPEVGDEILDLFKLQKEYFLEDYSLSSQESEHLRWIEVALKKVNMKSSKVSEFVQQTQKIDLLRGEDFRQTFPALSLVLAKAAQ